MAFAAKLSSSEKPLDFLSAGPWMFARRVPCKHFRCRMLRRQSFSASNAIFKASLWTWIHPSFSGSYISSCLAVLVYWCRAYFLGWRRWKWYPASMSRRSYLATYWGENPPRMIKTDMGHWVLVIFMRRSSWHVCNQGLIGPYAILHMLKDTLIVFGRIFDWDVTPSVQCSQALLSQNSSKTRHALFLEISAELGGMLGMSDGAPRSSSSNH